MKYVFWFIVLVVLAGMFGPTKEQKAAKHQQDIQALAQQKAEVIYPDDEIAQVFAIGSKYTDVQRENAERQLKGKVVQWQLPVYNVTKSGDNVYKIQTSPLDFRSHNRMYVPTFITLITTHDYEGKELEAMKERDLLTFKGVIEGVSMRHLVINPAMFIEVLN